MVYSKNRRMHKDTLFRSFFLLVFFFFLAFDYFLYTFALHVFILLHLVIIYSHFLDYTAWKACGLERSKASHTDGQLIYLYNDANDIFLSDTTTI